MLFFDNIDIRDIKEVLFKIIHPQLCVGIDQILINTDKLLCSQIARKGTKAGQYGSQPFHAILYIGF